MRRPYQILVPLLSLFLVRVDLTDLWPLEMKVRILKVYDGDTVLIQKGNWTQRVRLSPIDAPELMQPFWNGKPGAGQLAQTCLKKNLSSTGILRLQGHDIYHRMLGDLDHVAIKLVRQGCASLYPYAKFESVAMKYQFLKAMMEARKKRRGYWAFGGIQQPKAWRKGRVKKRSGDRPLRQ